MLFAGMAAAQVLYKWTDADGKVQYSDQPPKNFKGEVTRLEPPEPRLPAAAPRPAAPLVEAKEEAKAPAAPPEDINSKRREARKKLAANLEAAQLRLEKARAALALAGADGPAVDERQVVQQHFAKGRVPTSPRSNCREVVRDGKKSMMCPALVPGEAYYDRVRALEEAVKRAEEDLELAERAYRRGVD